MRQTDVTITALISPRGRRTPWKVSRDSAMGLLLGSLKGEAVVCCGRVPMRFLDCCRLAASRRLRRRPQHDGQRERASARCAIAVPNVCEACCATRNRCVRRTRTEPHALRCLTVPKGVRSTDLGRLNAGDQAIPTTPDGVTTGPAGSRCDWPLRPYSAVAPKGTEGNAFGCSHPA